MGDHRFVNWTFAVKDKTGSEGLLKLFENIGPKRAILKMYRKSNRARFTFQFLPGSLIPLSKLNENFLRTTFFYGLADQFGA